MTPAAEPSPNRLDDDPGGPPGPSKGPGRNRLLTHEQVARAAFDLVDAHGLAALTMTRLAKNLGVSPMTLYGYAESKDAIIAMLPEMLLADLPAISSDQPWQTAIEGIFLSIYQRLITHRHITQTITNSAVFGHTQAEVIEGVLACLEAAGFDPDDAFCLQRTLATYTLGFAFFAIAEVSVSDSSQSRTGWVNTLDPGEFPRLANAAPLLGAKVDETQYVRGLRRILGNSEAPVAAPTTKELK